MKKTTNVLSAVFAAFMATGSFANNMQAPVPLSEEIPLRVAIGILPATNFDQFTGLNGGLSFTHFIGAGVEWGLSAKGGATSNALFNGGDVNWGLRPDLMLRFLGGVTDWFYMGVQVDVGMDFTFTGTNQGPLTVTAGIPFTFGVGDGAWLFLFPSAEFGNRKVVDANNVVTPTSPESDRIFGSAIGVNLQAGFMVDLGGASLFVEGKPRFNDVTFVNSSPNSIDAEFALGVAFDL
jgi:hypothetical protein